MAETPVDEVIEGLMLLEHLHKGDGDPKWRDYARKAIERLAPVSDSELRHAITRLFAEYRTGGITQFAAVNTVLFFIRRERQQASTPRPPAAPTLDDFQSWAEEMSDYLSNEHARAAMRQAATNISLARQYTPKEPK